jgi:hypothetical protein
VGEAEGKAQIGVGVDVLVVGGLALLGDLLERWERMHVVHIV